jgi:hypothetical protein
LQRRLAWKSSRDRGYFLLLTELIYESESFVRLAIDGVAGDAAVRRISAGASAAGTGTAASADLGLPDLARRTRLRCA